MAVFLCTFAACRGTEPAPQSFDSEAAACQFFMEAISRTLKAINAKKGFSQER
jgi:hypothetical protein